MGKEKLQEIVACIKHHCPRLAKDADALSRYVNHVQVLHMNAKTAVKVSDDAVLLEKLERSLREASKALAELSPKTRNALHGMVPLLEHEKPVELADAIRAANAERLKTGSNKLTLDPSVLCNRGPGKTGPSVDYYFLQRASQVGSLLAGVVSLRKQPTFKTKSSTKLNYEAAAIAAACQKIWMEEHEIEKAPVIRHNRDHPLADFIEDMFEIFSVGSTAASATNSLKKLGGAGALVASIVIR